MIVILQGAMSRVSLRPQPKDDASETEDRTVKGVVYERGYSTLIGEASYNSNNSVQAP